MALIRDSEMVSSAFTEGFRLQPRTSEIDLDAHPDRALRDNNKIYWKRMKRT